MSHNVMEYLADPVHLMREAFRVLQPGGRAAWSHVDFAGIILNSPERALTRRVLEEHATFVPRWMGHANGYIGRQLPGLVRRSPLTLEKVDVHLTTCQTFDGDARWRVIQILETLRTAADRGQISLSRADLDRWLQNLELADRADDFLFVEPTFVVTSRKLV